MGCTINSAKRWFGACLKNGSRGGNEADGCARLRGNPPRYLGGYGAWGFLRHSLSFAAILVSALLQSDAGTPPAEDLLPEDTLFMMTVADFGRIREIFK